MGENVPLSGSVDEGTDVPQPPDVAEAAQLDFWQRITVGFNWAVQDVGAADEHVDVFVTVPEGEGGGTTRVRNELPNTGSSYVTFPGDFQGSRVITVVGSTGAASGEVQVPA